MTRNNVTSGNWSVFTAQDILQMYRDAYEAGFREAQQQLLADLDKLRDPVTLHPQHQWLRAHFENLVATAKPPKEPYNAEQIQRAAQPHASCGAQR